MGYHAPHSNEVFYYFRDKGQNENIHYDFTLNDGQFFSEFAINHEESSHNFQNHLKKIVLQYLYFVTQYLTAVE